ncbi:MAG TPA: methyltransferase domain-containing protein [Pyrinomonadaceae bacterium]
MSDADRWDERYLRGEHASAEASRLLVRAVDDFALEEDSPAAAASSLKTTPQRALDVACGAGRHALVLAARGFRVTAVDASRVGIEMTLDRARARGLDLDARVADLARGEFTIEPDAYQLVCDFYYLQRDLFRAMRAGLRRGGLFVAAIHTVDEHPSARPANPDFLLRPEELREQFRGWEILHYHETEGRDEDAGEHRRPSAEIIARRPAA